MLCTKIGCVSNYIPASSATLVKILDIVNTHAIRFTKVSDMKESENLIRVSSTLVSHGIQIVAILYYNIIILDYNIAMSNSMLIKLYKYTI